MRWWMSTGMGRMVAAVVACAVLAAQSLSAVAQERAALSARDLLGTWAGATPGGTPIELRVDTIGAGGRVAGALCVMRLSWIDAVTPLAGVGAVAVRTGHARFAIGMQFTETHVRLGVVANPASLRVDLLDAHTLDYMATPGDSAQAAGTLTGRARLRRVQRLPCLDRYSAVPRRLAVPGASVPILGFWTYPSPTGKLVEAAIESISPQGIVAGRFCIKMRKTQDIQLIDLDPLVAPRYLARYDTGNRSIVFERNRIESDGNRRRDRFVMTLSAEGGLDLAITQRYASPGAQTRQATLHSKDRLSTLAWR